MKFFKIYLITLLSLSSFFTLCKTRTSSSSLVSRLPASILSPSPIFYNLNTEAYWIENNQEREYLLKAKARLKTGGAFEYQKNCDWYTEWGLFYQGGNRQSIFSEDEAAAGIEAFSLTAGCQFFIENLDFRIGLLKTDLVEGYGSGSRSKTQYFYQSFFETPLLIHDWSFIGFMQKYEWMPKIFKPYLNNLVFTFRETIPTSSTYLNRFASVQDQSYYLMGSFHTDGVYSLPKKLRIFPQTKDVHFGFNLVTFYFHNPAAVVAEKGASYNTVRKNTVGSESEFEYSFYGLHINAGVLFKIFKNLDLEFKTSFLWNLGAPKDRNKGQSFYTGIYFPLTSKILFNPHFEWFVNQSDASPAYYNSDKYYHSDNSGFIVGFQFDFNYEYFMNIKYAAIQPIHPAKRGRGNTNYLKLNVGRYYSRFF